MIPFSVLPDQSNIVSTLQVKVIIAVMILFTVLNVKVAKNEHYGIICLLKLSLDSVAGELLEADIVAHLKQILTSSNAVPGLLHNSLMLMKSLCTIGQFSSTVGAIIGTCSVLV